MTFSLQPLASESNPIYALLVESLDDEHEVAVIRGVVNGARDNGATVLCVAGGAVDDPDPSRRARNLVFDLVSAKNVQGVITMSSAIGSARGTESLKQWLERYRDLPVCSLGVAIQDCPSVSVDNYAGMHGVVTHLITEHRAHRLGFIQGPSQSSECRARFAAFEAALAEHNIDLAAENIVSGDFSKSSGAQAIRTLFEQRRLSNLDALIAANDFMALGAMDELAQRGLRVPEDIMIVGFDDVESAPFVRPALTTVRQPAEQMGRQGAQLMTELLRADNSSTAPGAVLGTEVVIRNSCGCASVTVDLGLDMHAQSKLGLEASFVQRRQVILAEVVRAARGTFGGAGPGWESRLLDSLIAEARGDQLGLFNRDLHQVMTRIDRTVDGGIVQDMLSALRRQSLPSVANDPAARGRIEDAIHEARAFAGRFAEQAQTARARAVGTRFREFRSAFRERMFGASAGLSRALADHLPALGVEACVVATLEVADELASPARALFGFGLGNRLLATDKIALENLPTHPLLERSGRTLMLLPLVLDGQAIGATIMAVRTLNGSVLDELMELFAVAARVRTALSLR
jgi:DNA-binding LacI/PurR family transcriptional regulator